MTTAAHTTVVQAPDGRELCVEIVGDGPEGTVLICAGTPNSRHLYSRWVDDALVRGLRLIGYDRPGYGGSTPQPGHSVADGAADVRAIADQLGGDRLAVWGYSGGGPYALACAALLPDLVRAVGVVGSVAPWDAPGLDYFTGMGQENEEDARLLLSDPEAARQKCREDRERFIRVTTEQLQGALDTLLSPVDAAALRSDFAEKMVESIHAALAPGDQGWWDDGVAHMSPWGFDLGSIRVPVKIWHGRHDRFVPFQHGRWLAEHVRGAEAELSEDDGHLTLLINRATEVHEWLVAHLWSRGRYSFTAPRSPR